MHDPIAYTYEASEHCPDCAFNRFGMNERGFIAEDASDNEGNPVGAVFSYDAFEDRDMVCGTCGELIHEVEKRFVVTFPATVSIAVDAKNAAEAIDQVAYLDGEEILELDNEPGIFLYHSVEDLVKSRPRTGENLPDAYAVGF